MEVLLSARISVSLPLQIRQFFSSPVYGFPCLEGGHAGIGSRLVSRLFFEVLNLPSWFFPRLICRVVVIILIFCSSIYRMTSK